MSCTNPSVLTSTQYCLADSIVGQFGSGPAGKVEGESTQPNGDYMNELHAQITRYTMWSFRQSLSFKPPAKPNKLQGVLLQKSSITTTSKTFTRGATWRWASESRAGGVNKNHHVPRRGSLSERSRMGLGDVLVGGAVRN